MRITEKDVSYVADLANLELTEKERTYILELPGRYDFDALLLPIHNKPISSTGALLQYF